MIRGTLLTAILLLGLITLSGVWVVHTKYLTRLHFIEVQELRAQRDALDVEWNRLRLEEAALSTDVRVEHKARSELGMFLPRINDVMLIEDLGHEVP